MSPTCTCTPGQPTALTRGFLKPVPIPTRLGNIPVQNSKVQSEVAKSLESTCPVKATVFISVNYSRFDRVLASGGIMDSQIDSQQWAENMGFIRPTKPPVSLTSMAVDSCSESDKCKGCYSSLPSSFSEHFLSSKQRSVYDHRGEWRTRCWNYRYVIMLMCMLCSISDCS
jgi:hypothetical protein